MSPAARRRVLVVATDPLTERMPGPAIRAWHLAETLAAHHDVALAGTAGVTRRHPAMRVVDAGIDAGPGARAGLLAAAEVVVGPAGLLYEWPEAAASPAPMVVDLYDPYHLENLEPPAGGGPGASPGGRDETVAAMRRVIDRHLERGDFFLCASERQRDFWLGSLASVGRVNPYTYDASPGLDGLIDVVPFGLPAAPPARRGPGLRDRIAGIGPTDPVVLWAGGVYNWFDPQSLLEAVDRLRHRLPDLRLVFLGMGHPNPAVPAMRVAADARRLADDRGLTGRHVFFNEGWVPYEERADFLLDADVGVSTHLDHIEARFSFRTRVLDYLWAGLPMVLTGGDVLADLVAAEGLGTNVEPGDVAGIEAALAAALAGSGAGSAPVAAGRAERFAAVADRFRWDRVAGPLLAFCADPRPAPDRTARRAAPRLPVHSDIPTDVQVNTLQVPARPLPAQTPGAVRERPSPAQALARRLARRLARGLARVARRPQSRTGRSRGQNGSSSS